MDVCYIQNQESNQLVNRTKELLEQFFETPFDKVNHQGNIKHILVKYGHVTHELMLVIITYKETIKNVQTIIQQLTYEFPHLKSIVQNINPRHDNVILGEKVKILYGSGYIEDILLGNRYQISTKSFYQINPIQVERLYQKAIEYAEFQPDDQVIDAYCGIGTISLSLSKYVGHVFGVEIVAQASNDAKENARRNGIDNVLKPNRIVYISCDVATQARDIAYLQEYGYIVDICQPVDMFPHSYHIENIVRLSYQKNID